MEVVKFVSNFCNASTVILALLVIAILKYLHSIRRPSLYPPGPMGLPLLGYIPFLGSNMAETFRKLKKKYGTVISVNMGGEDFVVLNDYDTIHEVFFIYPPTRRIPNFPNLFPTSLTFAEL